MPDAEPINQSNRGDIYKVAAEKIINSGQAYYCNCSKERLDEMRSEQQAAGLKPQYDVPAKNNPLPWTTHWISSKGLQVAPQETEVESYVVGGIKQDVTKETFKGFSL